MEYVESNELKEFLEIQRKIIKTKKSMKKFEKQDKQLRKIGYSSIYFNTKNIDIKE